MADADVDYTISNARYARGKKLIRCMSKDGYATRAAFLVRAVNGRYTNREKGYVVSATQAQLFQTLFSKGWHGRLMAEGVLSPTGEAMTLAEARKRVK